MLDCSLKSFREEKIQIDWSHLENESILILNKKLFVNLNFNIDWGKVFSKKNKKVLTNIIRML